MSRNPELEALLQAKFDLDTAGDDQQSIHRRRFDELLDQAIARHPQSGITRSKLEQSLREAYRDFRRAKLIEQRARLSRLR